VIGVNQYTNGPLALLGGTFDPVHYGHLKCADEARDKLNLAKLYLLPSAYPPHRNAPCASIKQRLEMLNLARSEFPLLDVDDRETRRSGPSYMVDTLCELRREFPQRPVILLLGQDAANQLHTWYHWQRLFDLSHVVILTRPGTKAAYHRDVVKQIDNRVATNAGEMSQSPAGAVLNIAVASINVSSTTIKSMIGSGAVTRDHAASSGLALHQ